MIYLFFLLLLGHLLADFIFQPGALISWKYREWQGVAFHALIHFFVMLILVWVFLHDARLALPLLLIAISHLFIDIVKIKGEKRKTEHYFLFFLIDQCAHLSILAVASYLSVLLYGKISVPFQSFVLLCGVCGFIVSTIGIEMGQYQLRREKNPGQGFRPHYEGIFMRAVVFSLLFVALRVALAF